MKASYGINKQAVVDDIRSEILEEIRIQGFSILKRVVSPSELEIYRIRLDKVYEQQTERFGAGKLEAVSELNMARCPLAEDPVFLNMATHPHILDIVEHILGDYFILHLQNGIINQPSQNHHQSSWHRDLPYQNFEISSPLAVGALFCLDPFTHETGSTFVVPFSHRLEMLPSKNYIEKHGLQIEADPGDVMLFDSMILHRAGYNKSDIIRRGVNNVYVKPILKQQISLPDALGPDYTDDPFLLKFLGYDSRVPCSADEWRMNRISRLNAEV